MNEFKFTLNQEDIALISKGLSDIVVPFKEAGKVQTLINKMNDQIKAQLPEEKKEE